MQVMKLKVDTFHNTDFKNNVIIQILNSFSHIPVLYIHVLIGSKTVMKSIHGIIFNS